MNVAQINLRYFLLSLRHFKYLVKKPSTLYFSVPWRHFKDLSPPNEHYDTEFGEERRRDRRKNTTKKIKSELKMAVESKRKMFICEIM